MRVLQNCVCSYFTR